MIINLMSNRKKQADRIMAWFAKIEILTINFRQKFFSVNQCFLNSLIMLKIYKNDIIIVSSNFSQSFA